MSDAHADWRGVFQELRTLGLKSRGGGGDHGGNASLHHVSVNSDK